MGFLRSEEMKSGVLILPIERAAEVVDMIGREVNIEIEDMNKTSFSRPYNMYIQRIDDLQRILRFLKDEIKQFPGCEIVKGSMRSFLNHDQEYQLDEIHDRLQNLYAHFTLLKDNHIKLLDEKSNAVEQKCIVQAATSQMSFRDASQYRGSAASSDIASRALINMSDESGDAMLDYNENTMTFSHIAGVIKLSDQERFARILFRTTRGNVFTHFEPIETAIYDSQSREYVKKILFVAYGRGEFMLSKVKKICSAFGAHMYAWPRTQRDATQSLQKLEETILDKQNALDLYEGHFLKEINALLEVTRPDGGSLVEEWQLFCNKQKLLYLTLNKFESSDLTIRSNVWFPASVEDSLKQLLARDSNLERSGAVLLTNRGKTEKSPPTYNIVNEFTAPFQAIVDTFGIPRYMEVNPALFTMATFPFLFGVMYGDIGHGLILLSIAIYMIWNSESMIKRGGDIAIAASARYMLVMMACCAIFAGFMYNDFLSLGLNLFTSRWIFDENKISTEYTYWVPAVKFPYPFGYDPKWKGAVNELLVSNSYKMKLSVIVAFIQMLLGIFLKGANSVHFKQWLDFFFVFIPQVIFFLSFLGYLDFLIILKWVTPVESSNKPSIINTFIGMFLLNPVTDSDRMYSHQQLVQRILLVLMVLCVPTMLLVKPCIHWYRHKKHKRNSQILIEPKHSDDQLDHGDLIFDPRNSCDVAISNQEAEFDIVVEGIDQLIETIEFVLGVISNSASYLRLWALSLAHQQLSLVFFERILLLPIENGSNAFLMTIGLLFVFPIFAVITMFFMVGLDSLEVFLHAIRLQWVEFQNKFYKGDGYAYSPFSFKIDSIE